MPSRSQITQAVAVGVFAFAAGAAVTILPSRFDGKQLISMSVGLVAVIVLVTLTFTRFDLLVIVLLFGRISLDALKTGGTSGASLDPSVLVGAYFIAVAITYLLTLKRPVPSSPFTRCLYLLAGAAFASVWLSDHRLQALIAASKVLSGVLMFAVLEQMLHENPKLARRVVGAALASTVIPVVIALHQATTGAGNLATHNFVRVYGTAVTPTSLATYLLPILAVLIAVIAHPDTAPRRRRRAMLVTIAPVAVLYLTYTRSAWIALAIGIFYVIWRLRRSWVIPVLVGLVLVVVTVPGITARFNDLQNEQPVASRASANSLDWRLGYWKRTADRVGYKWLTGIGLDTTQIDDPSHLAPHNITVQLYVETGLLGSAAGLAAIFGFAATVKRRRQLATTPQTQILAVATGATGLMILIEGMSSNVLTQTIVYWYSAAALAWGLFSVAEPEPEPEPEPEVATPRGHRPVSSRAPQARPARR